MSWIKSHTEIWEHHKTIKLCVILKRPDYAIVGHLLSLWHFALRNAWRDSNLEPWGDIGIERAARWDGDPGVFVTALREVGFMDGFMVHDWQDQAGKLVDDRLYAESRRLVAKSRRLMSARGRGRGRGREEVEKKREDNTLAQAPIRAPFSKPSAEEVTAYAKGISFDLNGSRFCDHYEANGWRVGKNPMKDWKATVRNWRGRDFEGDKHGANEHKGIPGLSVEKIRAVSDRLESQGLRKVGDIAAGTVLDRVRNLPIHSENRKEESGISDRDSKSTGGPNDGHG